LLLGRAQYRCEACRRRSTRLDLEHAQARSQGGADTWENCWMACRACHRAKHGLAGTRLSVVPCGDGTFQFARGSYAWRAGRPPTPAECRLLGIGSRLPTVKQSCYPRGTMPRRDGMLRDAEGRPCVTMAEAARRVGVSREAVRDQVRRGRLPHQRAAGFVLVPLAAVTGWQQRRRAKAAARPT
jgi:excisionase family DNA binding protein